MSFARWNAASDVYVYQHCAGFLDCCGCASFFTVAEMLAHLEAHQAKGEKVPQDAIDVLTREAARVDAEMVQDRADSQFSDYWSSPSDT